MRRTKIVCTIGPSSSDSAVLGRLVHEGMDVARLNFSHGDHALHERNFKAVRGAADAAGRNVAVMADLQGPKIRTGKLEGGRPVQLVDNAPFCITTWAVPGNAACVSTTYENLPYDVRPGNCLLLADGLIELRVEKVSPPDVHCTVVHGAALGENKGINLPGVKVSAPCLTEKDIADLEFALALGADYVALSFVRTPDDLQNIKHRIAAAGKKTPVVAKIERPEALDHFDNILDLADGVMVARGDLGIEANFDEVPQIQKDLIRRCNGRGIPVITATQMLESMMANPRPTRAEVTDVANAIYDGTDAVMLSGETAAGQYPVEAVQVMAKVACKADAARAVSPLCRSEALAPPSSDHQATFSDAIGQAVHRIAATLPVSRIICFTMSGYTARAIARYRPNIPITAITLIEETRRRCALIWGVEAILAAEVATTDDMVRTVDQVLLLERLAAKGDIIIITAGTPVALRGRTNLLKLHTVGEYS